MHGSRSFTAVPLIFQMPPLRRMPSLQYPGFRETRPRAQSASLVSTSRPVVGAVISGLLTFISIRCTPSSSKADFSIMLTTNVLPLSAAYGGLISPPGERNRGAGPHHYCNLRKVDHNSMFSFLSAPAARLASCGFSGHLNHRA